MEPSDWAHDPVDVWPENLQAFELFEAMRTQWRVAMGGPVGLDYTVLAWLMDLKRVPLDERAALLDDIRLMESAALAEMSKTFD